MNNDSTLEAKWCIDSETGERKLLDLKTGKDITPKNELIKEKPMTEKELIELDMRILDKSGLNGDNLMSAYLEIAKIAANANHEQIHILGRLIETLYKALLLKHYSFVKEEGELQ